MAEEIQHPDAVLAPPSEQIHLPEPSHLPWLMAFGLMLTVTGVVLSIVLVIIGGTIFLITLVRWIRQTRDEMGQLPLEH